MIPTNYAKYPRVTVEPDLKSPVVRKEEIPKVSADAKKEPTEPLNPKIPELEPEKVSVDAKKESTEPLSPKIPELGAREGIC